MAFVPPEEIDYDQFRWLRKGDRIRIAEKTGMSVASVRHVLRKRYFNPEILAAAMELVVKNKRKIMEWQAEAQKYQIAHGGNK